MPGDSNQEQAVAVEARWRASGGPTSVEAASMLPSLLAAVPAPDPALFAAIDDAPTAPADAAAGAAWARAAALQLELAAQAAAVLGPAELGLEALAAQEEQEWRSGGGGGGGGAPQPSRVLVEEVEVEGDDAGAGSAAAQPPPGELPVLAVLAAALHGGDARLQRPWAAAAAADAAQQLLAAAAAQLPAVLAARPRQQAAASEPASTTRRSSSSGGAPLPLDAQQREQPAEVQQLVALAAPAALRRLQPVLLARVEHDRHRTSRLEPYAGPSNFERCVAAGQAAWLLCQLRGQHLGAVASAALPLLLAALEDPCPHVQACVLCALQHVGAEGQAADLRPHAARLLPAVLRVLAGGRDTTWAAAAGAAVALASRLEGDNPYALAYAEVMAALLDEGERGGHQPGRAAAWLAAAPPLFPRLGLQLAGHSARLLPLLLEWSLALRQSVRSAALEALLQALQLTWPRAAAHAPVVWRVLRRVQAEERRCRAPVLVAGGQAAEAAAAARLAEDCALVLWCAAGPDFQMQLMAGKEAPSDELLQAVMQRLEHAAAAAEAAEPGAPDGSPAEGAAQAAAQLLTA